MINDRPLVNIGEGGTLDRIAIISDIHSNRHALEAVAEQLEILACDAVYCLGDVVGYGSHPVPCLDWVKRCCGGVVQGNHDAMVADPELGLRFNVSSLAAVRHNHGLLAPGDLRWLGELPTQLEPWPGGLLVHGAPRDRDRYLLYMGDMHETLSGLQAERGTLICFFGHTHHPVLFSGSGFESTVEGTHPLPAGGAVLVNPGSVGQPRDGDPRASFLVYDRPAHTVTFVRVSYDVESAREDILAAGLPSILGDRLLAGR